MATKRTYQPKKLKRVRKHGFLKKMASHDGRKVIKRRRLQGRKKLTL
ncbi:MAG: 50S ribosomal protein L34 [Candidatus Shapirobacteria bacterium]|nr:50S ribosomal protein L34 [Candidatus Shapirobacteria bacterium]